MGETMDVCLMALVSGDQPKGTWHRPQKMFNGSGERDSGSPKTVFFVF